MGEPRGWRIAGEQALVGAERSGSTVENTVCCEAGSGEIKRRGKTDPLPQRIIRLRRSWHVLTDVIRR